MTISSREVSLSTLKFPITVAQLLYEIEIPSSSELKRIVWGMRITLNNTPLNEELAHIFFSPDDLMGTTLCIGRHKIFKFVE